MSIALISLLVIALVVVAVLVARLSGGSGGASDPQRLARLLLSEVKLYNDELVAKGVRDKTLLADLEEELHRARQDFLARAGDAPGVEAIFDREVVRILADGDEAALGR